MLSASFICDTAEQLPGMSTNIHHSILSEIKPAVNRLPTEMTRFILDLSYEIASTEWVRSRALEADSKRDLSQLFQDLYVFKFTPSGMIPTTHLQEVSVNYPAIHSYRLAVYELRFHSGLYLWTEIGTEYLPRDTNDTHCLVRCLELLNTVKTRLDDIPVRQYVHTPPQRDLDHLLPEDLKPQPTYITPSSRQFFGCIVKTSDDTPKSS
ncbi:hypothetical protein BG015_008671 [Linnemannia schmuckeri]|uniref:Uncharacterized protein n=1 Tax=Linnemannia schmuckeri TaxID=64567 RepID=A0A9P5VAC5_9FUNG|nr:hypothetical protein BG015_008671 [Linnemannia schmuckeri]